MGSNAHLIHSPEWAGLWEIFTTCLVVALLLLILILIIAFLALLTLQSKDRRNFFLRQNPRHRVEF